MDYGTEYSVSLTETEVGDVCDVHRLSVTVDDRVKVCLCIHCTSNIMCRLLCLFCVDYCVCFV